MITTILWDVDGTLLNFEAAEKAAIRALFQEFGFGVCTDEMLKRYSQINKIYWERLERKEVTRQEVLEGRFRDFFAEEGLDVSAAPEFNECYQTSLGDTIVFYDDSYEIVKSLRGKVKQYVVSNGTITAQTKKIRVSGLGELMDGIFLSEQLGVEKPDVHFFEQVFAQTGLTDKTQIMIVGDSLSSDILGGNNAGIITCWYNPEHKQSKNSVRIDYEITDLHEIYNLI